MPNPNPDPLHEMMKAQFELQRDTYGIDYSNMTDEERIHHFKEMLHAFNDEMHEALGEMGWKPWATARHFNTLAVQAELIDAWHFFMNLMLIAKLDPVKLYAAYMAKRAKNIKRQQEGYDGVSTKCTKCRRAFDDDEVYCHPSMQDGYDCCHYQTQDGELVKRNG
jgi:hypothetical protein